MTAKTTSAKTQPLKTTTTSAATNPTPRAAGILLHPTSLPGAWASGDFGFEAEAFLDWAAETGFSLWQILPITSPAGGDSPYTSLSAFAIHPMLISIDRLLRDGLLVEDDVRDLRQESGDHCDMCRSREIREPLLRRAFERYQEAPADWDETFRPFLEDPLQGRWLDDWCLFAALRREVGNHGWWTWPEDLARRRPEALAKARKDYAESVAFERFLQCVAFGHWRELRAKAAEKGIEVIGDLPIYVAYDSADLWTHPELFELDDDLKPIKVAGVPPDYFSEDGQLWGNPLYRWDVVAERGFDWWIDRLRINFSIADHIRLDHFRAFAGYWEVDAAAETARDGCWRPGPGKAFFDAVAAELGDPLPLVAEDLGEITDDVHELRRAVGLPCMRVLQFGFDPMDGDHAPHRLREDTLLYTGTHDNETTLGWYLSLSDEQRHVVRSYGGKEDVSAVDDLIRMAYTSVARWAVIPMQDALFLGSEARMNTPGVAEGNWGWRMKELPGPAWSGRLHWLARISGRLPESHLSEEEDRADSEQAEGSDASEI